MIRLTRCACTTLTDFHVVWSSVFDLMENHWGEAAAATALKKEYFFRIDHDVAKKQYRAVHLPRLSEGKVWCAPFWAGLYRAQPGSASGSQAQESFHFNVLAPQMQDEDGEPLRRAIPPQVVEALAVAVEAQGGQVRKQDKFVDLPTHEDPISMNSPCLASLGRTTARELFEQPDLHWHVQVEDMVVLPSARVVNTKMINEITGD